MSQATTPAATRILFIGNSQFRFHNIPLLVQDLAAGVAAPLLCEGCLVGGAWLATHLANADTLRTLDAGGWQTVVLQDHYQASEGTGPAKSRAATVAMVARVQRAGAVPVLYASPNIEANGDAGFRAIHALTQGLARELGVRLACSGAACLRARQFLPGLDLHDQDRQHPNYAASYIGACAVYAAVTGRTPVSLPAAAGAGAVTAGQARVFQEAAWAEYLAANPSRD